MSFLTPKHGMWDCKYCGNSYSIEEFEKIQEKEKMEELDTDMDEYECPNCGAIVVTDKNTSATSCVYCGNTTIIKNRLQNKFKPDKIIPFKITKEEAIKIYKNFIKERLFAPKEFTIEQNIEKITGIYIPFWLYDCNVETHITAIAKKINTWIDKPYKYTKTDEYICERRGSVKYIDIPLDGAKKFRDDIMNSIQPYNYEDFKEFNRSYLSGFLAEKYDVEKDIGFDVIEKNLETSAIQALCQTIKNYNNVDILNSYAFVDKGQIEYALLPVWLLNIECEGKTYTLAINGQTEKIAGNIPIQKTRIIRFILSIFFMTTIISLLIHMILGIL